VTYHQNSRRISGSLSRRDMLRAGGLLLPAAVLAPALLIRVSQAAGSGAFDYYISTTGNNSNPGTLAAPWAITAINTQQSVYAGKRLGILPGIYDISVMMRNAGSEAAVLQIQGGPNSSTRTYIGTSNASGIYQQGTATLDCHGSVGAYGGGNGVYPYPIGQTGSGTNVGPRPSNLGNWTLDGLIITGFSNWAIAISDYGGFAQIPNATIQNCTFANSVCTYTTTHPGPIMIYRGSNILVSNCWLYNNVNTAADNTHYAGIMIFAIGGPTTGVTIEKCTIVNSSCINAGMDNFAIDNVTIRQCYIDMTEAGTNFNQHSAMMGFMKAQTGLIADSIHNNIIKGGSPFDVYPADQGDNAIAFYNNTWDLAGGSPAVGVRFEGNSGYGRGQAGGTLFSYYNNLIYDNGATNNGYGYVVCNSDGFTVCDYNIYGAINKFATYPAFGGTSGPASQTFASWKTAIGGDSHSSTNSTNPFTNTGSYALQYLVQSGSPAYQAGRVGGVASGAACNIGAWDGTVAQIGCNFAGGVLAPNAPLLRTVS
jgi:hypothetical protein